MQIDHPTGPSTAHPEKAVFRNLAIPVSAFDHIKDTQRALQATTGQVVSINQTVAHIVRQHKNHQQNAAPAERSNHVPSILKNRP